VRGGGGGGFGVGSGTFPLEFTFPSTRVGVVFLQNHISLTSKEVRKIKKETSSLYRT
jgi:hypothetical protein